MEPQWGNDRFFKIGQIIEVKLKQINPRTNDISIFKSEVLQMGHKPFVEKWAKDAYAQTSYNKGTIGFVPLVPLVDPD